MPSTDTTLGHVLDVMTEAAQHYDSCYQYDLAERMRNARTMVSVHDQTLAVIRRQLADEMRRNAALQRRIAELEEAAGADQ